MSKSLSSDTIKNASQRIVRGVSRYKVFVFFLVASALYGFIVWRINVLASAGPTDAELQIAEKSQSIPVIKASVVKKIQNLKDNSVNVQALFEDARNNPFSE